MQQLKIMLRRNEVEQTLLEINGKTYEAVDIAVALELVKQALIQAEEHMIKQGTRYTH
jgi:hypothetical protein